MLVISVAKCNFYKDCLFPTQNTLKIDMKHRKGPSIYYLSIWTRDRPRFFDQVGYQTTNASIGNTHFSLNNDLIRLTKIMNNFVKDLKILSFQSHFSVSKIGRIFPPNNSVKNI